MEAIRGRRAPVIDAPAFAARLACAPRVLLDIGTGDGRFVQHAAQHDPALVAVGIDACREQLRAVSRSGPDNAVFLIATAAALPSELAGIATRITVNFPWGSLLHGLLDGSLAPELARLGRPGAQLEIRLNGGALSEAGVDLERGAEQVRIALRDTGFVVRRPTWWGTAELRAFPSTWARKLAFGRDPRAVVLNAVV
jgi:16S rRNA (adenine(1408)-N(1))-methyltransferase